MKVSPEILLANVETTPYVDDLIAKGIARLEQVYDNIVSVRVALEREQGSHHTGNPYHVRIIIRIPGRADIVVKRLSKASKMVTDQADEEETLPRRATREEPLPALVRRSFDSARRELIKIADKQRSAVKTPTQQQAQAVVEKIFREQQYGFLRTMDGQQVYFHGNSVLHRHWEGLTVGTIVRYTPEMGDKGLQASTVEPMDKPGTAEQHQQLHDMPALS